MLADDRAPHLSVAAALRADVRRSALIACFGCAVLWPVEFAATIAACPARLGLAACARLAAVSATLVAVACLVVAASIALVVCASRLAAVAAGSDGCGVGVLAWPPPARGARAGVAQLWAFLLVGGAYVANVERIGAWAFTRFREPHRTALLVAVAAAALAGVGAALVPPLRRGIATAAAALYPRYGAYTPITSWRGATTTLVVIAFGSMAATSRMWPAIAPELPWRAFMSATAFGAGGVLGARLAANPLRVGVRRSLAVVGVAMAVLAPFSLGPLGSDPSTKLLILSSSPMLARTIGVVRLANDFDRDGFGSLLGENDCAPFDSAIHPGAREIPDDGIDQDCDGHDFSRRDLAGASTPSSLPIPARFAHGDYNVLFLTIDTVRYDHTTVGGYAASTKHRDTTPNLERLADRSTSFDFAVAPAAGTMASVPAILTSRYFHNGLALDESNLAPGMPPRLSPENVLLPEIMKRGGYVTGAILTHEYFLDWGMNQGVDDLDLELARNTDPYKVSSSEVTDRALAWISRHAKEKWFLWAHYLDPHGRYVAHPEDVDYGSTEEDKYDSELFHTDKHIGRLLDELGRIPGGDRTLIVVTSDHGDAFGEHGFINHGQALYWELLHVPMIVHVPANEPRRVAGVVSPLDLVPTVAKIVGIDVSDLRLEGRSLSPQIFYGRVDPARIVFSETNWPKHLRSATSSTFKLIFDLDDNLYELYDLVADPRETKNVASSNRAAFDALRQPLSAFLERVVFARDPASNQLARQIGDILLSQRPYPAHAIADVAWGDGRLELVGWDVTSPRAIAPGGTLDVAVYFAVRDTPRGAFRLVLDAWPAGDAHDGGESSQRVESAPHVTRDGLFPSERWRAGDFIRQRFQLAIPADWPANAVTIGLRVTAADEPARIADGSTGSYNPAVTPLGSLELARP